MNKIKWLTIRSGLRGIAPSCSAANIGTLYNIERVEGPSYGRISGDITWKVTACRQDSSEWVKLGGFLRRKDAMARADRDCFGE